MGKVPKHSRPYVDDKPSPSVNTDEPRPETSKPFETPSPKMVGAIVVGVLMLFVLLDGAGGAAKTAAFPP